MTKILFPHPPESCFTIFPARAQEFLGNIIFIYFNFKSLFTYFGANKLFPSSCTCLHYFRKSLHKLIISSAISKEVAILLDLFLQLQRSLSYYYFILFSMFYFLLFLVRLSVCLVGKYLCRICCYGGAGVYIYTSFVFLRSVKYFKSKFETEMDSGWENIKGMSVK